jgi:DNA-binding MarR family transcriptional regulator
MTKSTRAVYFELMNEIGIISQLSRTIMEARLPDGVGLPHFSVLNHLIRVQDGRTPLDLARAFQVPKTTMTHTLTGLQTRKLIEMRANPKDGRSKQVWLTAAGRTFRDNAISHLDQDMEMLARAMSPEEVSALVPQLAKIRSFLDSHRGKA